MKAILIKRTYAPHSVSMKPTSVERVEIEADRGIN